MQSIQQVIRVKVNIWISIYEITLKVNIFYYFAAMILRNKTKLIIKLEHFLS